MSTPHPPREITAPVELCDAQGRLNPDAVGWSRRPLHRCNLRGAWGRKKRWDYWCVTSTEAVLAVTYADLDYLGLVTVMVHHRPSDRAWEGGMISPLGLGFRQAETVDGGDLAFRMPGLRVAIRQEAGATRLVTRFRPWRGPRVRADVRVALPPGHETLNVVVPWSPDRFQFTSKHNSRPAEGEITVGREVFRLGAHNEAFGGLDFGRGIWPHRTVWNWGSASGHAGGRVLGLQLGGQWTDGTGQTENGICVDGRLSKIHEDVRFDFDRQHPRRPWHIHTPGSGRVDLTLTPELFKPLRVRLGPVGAHCDACFGTYRGTVVPDSGAPIAVEDLFGWAEEMHARW